MNKIKNIAFYFLRISVTLFLLIFLFRKIDFSATVRLLKEADLFYLIIASLIFGLLMFLIIFRWYMLLKIAGIRIPFKRATVSYCIGLFFNMFLPSTIGGDVVRSFDIFEYAEDKSRIFATVILDRVSGLVSVVAVSFIAILFGFRFVNDISVIITFCILLVIVVLVLLMSFSRRAFKATTFLFRRFSAIEKKLSHFNESTVFFRDKKSALLKNLILSVVIRLGMIMIFYFFALAMHHKSSFIFFLIFVPILEAVASAPIAIGGLGVRDAAAVFLFTKVGFSSEIAISMSLLNFIFATAVGFIGGIIYVLTLRSRRV